MQYGQIEGLDRPVSRVVLGSMGLNTDDPSHVGSMIERYLERGGNMIDTANVYGGGKSERSIGEWVKRSGRREDILLLTKGAHHDKIGKRVSPDEISLDLGQSLERLGVRSVDLYVLHRDNPDVPVGPIVKTLNHHLARGRIKAFGGSNWSHERLREASAYARRNDLKPFAASSPNLALAVPKEPMWPDCISIAGDREAQAWYRRAKMPVLSWSSQAGGFFTGRFTPEKPDNADMVRVYYKDANWERYRRAEQLGKELGYSTIQIALAWVMNQPDLNVFALIGPKSIEELDSSLDAAELRLTPKQVRWLNLES
ncbi:MAG TPA: aldo/keto reductase [Chloroflexota bacterium]|nr:aldo/keto reductase [Chloroflexota bacterium]